MIESMPEPIIEQSISGSGAGDLNASELSVPAQRGVMDPPAPIYEDVPETVPAESLPQPAKKQTPAADQVSKPQTLETPKSPNSTSEDAVVSPGDKPADAKPAVEPVAEIEAETDAEPAAETDESNDQSTELGQGPAEQDTAPPTDQQGAYAKPTIDHSAVEKDWETLFGFSSSDEAAQASSSFQQPSSDDEDSAYGGSVIPFTLDDMIQSDVEAAPISFKMIESDQ